MTLLILLALGVLAYLVVRGPNSLRGRPGVTSVSKTPAELGPLFTESDVCYYKENEKRHQLDHDKAWREFVLMETNEVRTHHEAGKSRSQFNPSDSARIKFESAIRCLSNRDRSRSVWRDMVEANIAVLNGNSFDEVQQRFEQKGLWPGMRRDDWELEHSSIKRTTCEQMFRERVTFRRSATGWASVVGS